MKVLVIDGDPSMLDGMTVALQFQWHDAEVLAAARGDTGLRLFFDHDPDVVMLEVCLPDLSGFDIVRQIRRVSDVPILVVTTRTDETDQVRGLELGADEYITKPCGFLALIARIKAVLRRAELLPPERSLPDLVVGDLVINFRDRDVLVRGERVKLTPVEYKLLYHLVRNAGHLMPHEALLDRVWGAEYGHTADHLKVFISRLRSKIEQAGGPHYIETERGVGYRFVHPDHVRAEESAAPSDRLRLVDGPRFVASPTALAQR
jgi:two-component system KDP operon response regulator KdpE